MKYKGFTLIEALALLFVFGVITATFYAVFTAGTVQILESKNRLSAIAVANEKMEIIRNLDYDAIGTKALQSNGTYAYGIPGGEILEDESIAVNTRTFLVHTFVQYIDDAYDGKAVATTPIDLVPNDYKRVKVEVSWGEGGASHTVALVSTFVPKGIEVSSGGGTLSINVIDNTGTGVSGATAHITNTAVTPHINITTNTDSTGNLIFPGAPASSQAYKLEVSKNGYYGVTTYAPYPDTTYNPIDIHASVVEAAFNQKTIVMDKSSNISITTKDVFGVDLPDIGFHLVGGRKIGDTTDVPPVSVYPLNQNFDSGSSAKVSRSNEASGAYTFTLLNTAKYQLLRLSGADSTTPNIFSAVNGASKDVDATIINKETAGVLFVVKDPSSGVDVVMPNVSIHLTNIVAGYDATITTDQYGQAYFPATAPALTPGTYDYTITMTGYADQTDTVTVTSTLETKNITLTTL